MRIYGSQFRAWQGGVLAPDDVIKMYEGGFAGVYKDPDEDAKLASYGYATADEALSDAGLVGAGDGKLSLPFLGVLKLYPGCLPGPAQRIGDCVTHGGKNAGLVSMCGEVLSGKPDPVSGKLEVAPEVGIAGVRAGVLATEGYYHYRDHPDDGWTCSAIANVMVQHLGAIIRKDYGFADLTNYDPQFAKKFWKKSQIPREIYDAFDNNKFSDAATCRTLETVRDAVASGLGVNSCGGEGFSGERDENGVMRRKGSWAHAMAIIGCDDRPETIRQYRDPLFLVQNSWGKWGRGSRKIMGTQHEIPEGAFWARWSDIKNRTFIAIAGLNGWHRESIPDWLGGW